VEREGFPIANLVAKMEAGELDQAPVHTDVKQFPFGKFRGQVDILSGGFPCQPFSCAGQRKATDDPRHLFPYIRDGIRDCQPRIVFLENVGGIISAKTGDGESVLKYVLRELEGLGYRATAGVFSAEEVGAPHQRKRVFILGMANGEDIGRGGRTHRHGDDGAGLQEQEAQEQSNIRGETAGCSGDSRGGEELGNSSDLRLQQSSSDSRETGTDQSGEERGVYEPQGTSSLPRYGSQSQGSQGFEWPSRPGEPQHEWEEPRVVADTKSQQGSSPDNGGEREHLANRKKSNLEEDIAGHCGKATGKLNPNWVEHLMGLPVGWTQLPTEWIDSDS